MSGANNPTADAWESADYWQQKARAAWQRSVGLERELAACRAERAMDAREPADPFGEGPTARVAGFLTMLLASHALDEGLGGIDDVPADRVVLSLAGDGASDQLTAGDVRAFLAGEGHGTFRRAEEPGR